MVNLRHCGRLLLGFSIAIGALVYTFWNVSIPELLEQMAQAKIIYFFPSIGMIVLAYIIRVYRWKLILSSLYSLKLASLYPPYFLGNLSNILMARAGDFFRPLLLSQREKVPFGVAMASIAIERFIDLIFILAIVTTAFILSPKVLLGDINIGEENLQSVIFKFGQVTGILLIFLGIVFYLAATHNEKISTLLISLARPLPIKWQKKIVKLVEGLMEGFTLVKDVSSLFKVLSVSTLAWLTSIFSLYPLYWAYDLEVKSIFSLLLLNAMVSICIAVLPTPAVLGSFQAGVLIALNEIMGENKLTAASFSMTAWGLYILVLFGLSFYYIPQDQRSMLQFANEADFLEKK